MTPQLQCAVIQLRSGDFTRRLLEIPEMSLGKHQINLLDAGLHPEIGRGRISSLKYGSPSYKRRVWESLERQGLVTRDGDVTADGVEVVRAHYAYRQAARSDSPITDLCSDTAAQA